MLTFPDPGLSFRGVAAKLRGTQLWDPRRGRRRPDPTFGRGSGAAKRQVWICMPASSCRDKPFLEDKYRILLCLRADRRPPKHVELSRAAGQGRAFRFPPFLGVSSLKILLTLPINLTGGRWYIQVREIAPNQDKGCPRANGIPWAFQG